MTDPVTLVLADGAAAVVERAEARSLADALWDAALEPGAPTAAARIVEALRLSGALRGDVRFDLRETNAVVRVAGATVQWTQR
jgi:hypothetical protein